MGKQACRGGRRLVDRRGSSRAGIYPDSRCCDYNVESFIQLSVSHIARLSVDTVTRRRYRNPGAGSDLGAEKNSLRRHEEGTSRGTRGIL